MNKTTTIALAVTVFQWFLIVGCDNHDSTWNDTNIQAGGKIVTPDAEFNESPQTIIVGKVIAVQDGDTVDILDSELRKIRIRFYGIDAPESGQPFGRNAKTFVSDAIGGKTVAVLVRDIDRYGRTIGDIVLNQQRLSVEIVQAGLAWHYVLYAPEDVELADAEAAAKNERRGLWADPRYVAPWEWRRLSKEERDKLR